MRFVVRTTLALLAVVGLTAAPAAAQQAGQIVFIDSERLRQEAPGLQRARQKIQEEMTSFQQRADTTVVPLQADIQRLRTELQQQRGTMTAGQQRQQEQQIATKQRELQAEGAQLEEAITARQREILQPALQNINEVIQAVRADNGYAYVLDGRAPGILSADPQLDITDEVLRRLNAQASPGS